MLHVAWELSRMMPTCPKCPTWVLAAALQLEDGDDAAELA
jgi:hypothetical protein